MASTTPPLHRRYVDLTPDKEQKISQLVELMHQTFQPLPAQLLRLLRYAPTPADAPTTHNTVRHYCYCVLISRDWDVQKALDMMKANVAHRLANKLDTRSELPAAVSLRGWDEAAVIQALQLPPRTPKERVDTIVHRIGRHFPSGVHYWDRYGQPVFYVMMGRVHEEMLLRKLKEVANVGQAPEDVMWEVLQHLIGAGEWLAYYQQMQYDEGKLANVDASEGLIRATTIVIDMKGFGYSMIWKPAIDLAVSCLKRLLSLYAECVHQILVVNAPSMVWFGYRVISPAIPSTVHAKVRVADADGSLRLLKEYVDEEMIPSHLGGRCRCAGGCFAHLDASAEDAVAAAEEHASGGVSTEDITLRAGKAYRKVFVLHEGESVVWDFVSTSGHDVGFATFFIPQSIADGVNMDKVDVRSLDAYAVSRSNPSEGSGEYSAGVDGVLLLVWDNKQSWVTSKHLQMKVYKQ